MAWAKSYEVNLRGPVFLVQKALPHLKASPSGAVLNMVSVGAFNFAPTTTIYASGKGRADVGDPVDGCGVRVATASGSTRSRQAPWTPT